MRILNPSVAAVGILIAGVATSASVADTITWNGQGDGVLWHDPANWVGGVVPGFGDDVFIGPAYSVRYTNQSGPTVIDSLECPGSLEMTGDLLQIENASEIDELILSGGTLDGAGDITILGPIEWTGGKIDGSGILYAEGGINLSGAAVTLDRRLESIGTTTWSGTGDLRIDLTGTFVNMPGALFDVQNDKIITYAAGGPGVFRNLGTFRKSVGTGLTSVRIEFINDGAVEANAADGRIEFRKSTHYGTVSAVDGLVQLSTGYNIFMPGSTFTAPLRVVNGVVFMFGDLNVPVLTVEGGILELATGDMVEVDELVHSGGTTRGVDDITVTGPMTWDAGEITGTGTLYADGDIEVSSGIATLNRRLESAGTTTWSTTQQFRISVNGTFVNLPGAVFDARNDAIITWGTGAPGVFDNQGTFRKSLGASATDLRVEFLNTGLVEALSIGRIQFREYSTHWGSIASTDGLIEFITDYHTLMPGSDLSAPTLVSGGNVFVLGDFEAPTLTVSSGVLDLNTLDPVDVGTYVHSGGTLWGTSDIVVSGPMTWTGGAIRGSGTFFADDDIDLSGGTKTLNRRLESKGTTTWTGTGTFRIDPFGVFVNMPGALFDVRNDATLSWSSVGPGVFDNRGTFHKSLSVGTTDTNTRFFNSGSFEALSGLIRLRQLLVQTDGVTRVDGELELLNTWNRIELLGGVLSGTGLLDGDIDNDGADIAPGGSVGSLAVEGDVDQRMFASMTVELEGSAPGQQDVLAVDGDVFLRGLLRIRLLDGFQPMIGETYTILTATGEILGTFDEVTCESLVAVHYLPTEVQLEIIGEPPVADLDNDCAVGFNDLSILLGSWGPCPVPPAPCVADLDDDGSVGFGDLSILLGSWG
jgi:hypothetical protein